MNLRQLDKLIKEELKAYLREEEEMDMDMGDEGDDIEVTTDEPEDEGEEAVDVLRQIYDMLKPIVDNEEEEMDMEDMEGEEEEEEGEEEEEEEEEIDEAVDNHTFFRGDNVNHTNPQAKDVQGTRQKMNESVANRFKKLANIKK